MKSILIKYTTKKGIGEEPTIQRTTDGEKSYRKTI